MGVKNIHIVLIFCSIMVAAGFGFWALKQDSYKIMGAPSLIISMGLAAYFAYFLNKVKAL